MKDRLLPYLLLSAFILPLNAQTFPQPELWLRDTATQVINPATDSVLSYEVLNSVAYVQDSLYLFCEQIGEDSTTISQIKNSPDAKIVRNFINNYLSLLRLGYNRDLKQYEWYPGWEDSLYCCKYADYLTKRIVEDTALYLINGYLVDAYIMLIHHEYASKQLLYCVEYSIERFHSRNGYLVTDLYYNKKGTDNWQEKLQLYEMTMFVLLNSEKIRYFDKDTNMKFDSIIAESNELSPQYWRFRNLLDGFSDIDLARISEEQKKELVKILLQGMANGEKKSQMTYAFMLLTGQFVEKDEALGNELLHRLLE